MGKVNIFKIKVFESNPEIFICHSERSEESLLSKIKYLEISQEIDSLGMTVDNRKK